ncbi:LacI family DNA-binding transcriptional regulator [Danxiaibacter flavus]|uniref:LacI family DNA-binding transcriptional regulator n=1 Tax=Danxiaibacter flavus TaxID=3049108 RepID=A0ABV3ZL73_9BACT|nr:LacI family DNA-binding transcriptional regulator [Chitinophagaceae bacterium DXS]
MSYKVTIADIAKELNTTAATVSRALNNHPAISDETKHRVAEAAERLHYKPNKIASSLRSGKSFSIGVIIPSAEINFFGSVVHGIENLANINGYNVLIYQTNESRDFEVKGLETFLSARVDGILASIAKETSDYSHFIDIKQRGIPIVFFDRANDDLGISSVVVDDYRGGYLATEHLIEQGYRRIAHISGPQHIKIFNDRLKGYMGALQAHNIKVDFDLVYAGDVSIEAGKAAIKHMMELPHPPDAVFAVEDFTALGAIKELKDRNIKIPEQFGVIGFANELFGEHITPSLSTIDQQTVNMGKESFRLLLELINTNKSKAGKEAKLQKVVLKPVPIFRQSSAKR